MAAHLDALIVGHGAAHLGIEAVKDIGEALGSSGGLAIGKLDQGDVEGGGFWQSAYLGAVHLAFDEVAFPVSWNQALLYFLRAVIDQRHVGYALTPIPTVGSLPAPLVGTAEQGEYTSPQLPPRHGVEGGVDGFVGKAHRLQHTTECARNLLRTQAPPHLLDDQLPEDAAHQQLAHYARLGGQIRGSLLGSHRPIPVSLARPPLASNHRIRFPTVTAQLAADRGPIPFESGGYSPRTQTQLQLRLNHYPLLQ